MQTSVIFGTLLAIALRERAGAPMREVAVASLEVGGGLNGDGGRSRRRGVTLLAQDAWTHACRELHVDLHWTSRRANLLVAGLDLQAMMGHGIEIGRTRVFLHGETKPCGLMDKAFEGLRQALKNSFRGGAHGEIIQGGTISIGDRVAFIPSPAWAPRPETREPRACSPE
jgi:MOSC domain-containing protein YiiM